MLILIYRLSNIIPNFARKTFQNILDYCKCREVTRFQFQKELREISQRNPSSAHLQTCGIIRESYASHNCIPNREFGLRCILIRSVTACQVN